MNSFYLDSLIYDRNLAPEEQDRNSILATGINKQTVKKLAKQLFISLVEELKNTQTEEEENVVIQNNIPAILGLHGIMTYYYTITGKSTDEPGGKKELLGELASIIDGYQFGRKKRNVALSFLSESKRLQSSEIFIKKHWEQIRSADTSTISSSTALTDIEILSGHRKLCLIYANIISRYLLEMRGTQTKSIQDNTFTKVLKITECL